MSFGGQSNPPWQRNNLSSSSQQAGLPSLQTQMGLPNPGIVGFQQNQSLFNSNLSLSQSQQPNLSILSQMGGNINQLSNNQLFGQSTVSYSANRSLNPIAFQQSNSSQSNQPIQNNLCNQNLNYNKIGIVTKHQNDYGFVDEEIFFHKNVCKTPVKIGDRVLVEANYNPNSPFKWNATRIQIVNSAQNTINSRNQVNLSNQSQRSFNTGSSQNEYTTGFSRSQTQNLSRKTLSPRRSPDRHPSSRSGHDREFDDDDKKRRRDERDKDRHRKRDHSPGTKRDRSPRRPSPKRRRGRPVPRYMVQIPKISLNIRDADVLELKRRYNNLYIPSDFIMTQIRWSESFPATSPYCIHKPCSFRVMHKSVDPIVSYDNLLDPPDIDYLFSAKVMLMSVPSQNDMYGKCFQIAEEKDKDEEREFIHPTRLINFLVGVRGKNETMAIGGPWSPSLDGLNPEKDPKVLIKTAIRTCKALTGIDLSKCTQWYRFVELYYHRAETCHKGRVIPARIETVVIYLPDVRSCMPTQIEWDEITTSYRNKLEMVLDNKSNAVEPITDEQQGSQHFQSKQPEVDKKLITSSSVTVGVADNSHSTSPKNSINRCDSAGDINDGVEIENPSFDSNKQYETGDTTTLGHEITDNQNSVDRTTDENCTEVQSAESQKDTASGSDVGLNPKSMKVTELRAVLESLNLSSKGLKPQLVARLDKALKSNKNIRTTSDEHENDDSENNYPGDNDDVDATETTRPASIDEPIDGDLDMMDIVIIDEYDSTRNDLKNDDEYESRKAIVKSLDYREKQQIERRYQLPETPHIIVTPSRIAKSGKFDCSLMSLSVLLDYRQEDNKEHSFEVSLFAELFNEMLMRDFGFKIFQSIQIAPEKTKEKEDVTKIKENKKENSVEEEAATKSGSKQNDVIDVNDTDDSLDKKSFVMKKENDQNDSNTAKDRDVSGKAICPRDDSEEDCYSIKSSGDRKKQNIAAVIEKERQKYYTALPELLLAFVYFDTTHCGYIFEKDIEDLFHTLGLCLSRSQTRKLLGKVISRDSLYYRKLTDKPLEYKECKAENESDADINCDSELNINNSSFNIGNKDQFPIFKQVSSNDDVNLGKENSEIIRYKGGVIDVEKMLKQIKRLEQSRDETDKILANLRKQSGDLQTSNEKAQSKIKELNSDLKSSTRKISDLEGQLSTTNKKCSEYYSVLNNISDKISPYIKVESSSTRGKDEKYRDKDKREREKDDKERIKHEKDAGQKAENK